MNANSLLLFDLRPFSMSNLDKLKIFCNCLSKARNWVFNSIRMIPDVTTYNLDHGKNDIVISSAPRATQ